MQRTICKTVAPGVLLFVAGCVAPNNSAPPAVAPAPPTYSTLGLEAVMGQDARALEALFGRADLDIREGYARKLQFSSTICVLDAYLYPRSQGSEAVVTYIDSRLPDGRDFDRASCVAALSRREQAR